MGQYYYIPDPGEQKGGYAPPAPDRLAQLRQQHMQQPQPMIQQGQIQPSNQTQTVMGAPSFQVFGVQDYDNNWVSSQEEANNWLVAPGHSVIMRDVNNRYIYVKSRDTNGIPSPLRVFEDISVAAQQDMAITSQIDLSRYVTIDQLEEILSERLKKSVRQTKPKEDTENNG